MKSSKSLILFLIASIAILFILVTLTLSHSNEKIPIGLLLVLFILLLCQALYIFTDAKKRNEKYYWFWGLFGLLNFPSSLVIYLLVTRVILKDKNKTNL